MKQPVDNVSGEPRDAVMELLAGYDTYADVADMGIDAAVDAPATTTICIVSSIVSITVARGC